MSLTFAYHWNVVSNVLDDVARDLVSQLLKFKPEERIAIAEVLRHPWLNGVTDAD